MSLLLYIHQQKLPGVAPFSNFQKSVNLATRLLAKRSFVETFPIPSCRTLPARRATSLLFIGRQRLTCQLRGVPTLALDTTLSLPREAVLLDPRNDPLSRTCPPGNN